MAQVVQLVAVPEQVTQLGSQGLHRPSANWVWSQVITGVLLRLPGWPVTTKLSVAKVSRRNCACVTSVALFSSAALYHVLRSTASGKLTVSTALASQGVTLTRATKLSSAVPITSVCHPKVGQLRCSSG